MKRVIVGVLAIAVLATVASTGVAEIIDWNYTNIFSGTATPNSFVTATIADTGTGVTLTMSITGSSTTEYVSKFYFNYASVANLLPSNISFQSGQEAGSVYVGSNSFKAGGDGWYDLLFSFDSSGGSGNRFMAGESSVYFLPGLSAADFNVYSLFGGGAGPFVSAIQVRGIGGATSSWLSPNGNNPVPELGSMILLGSGLVGFAAWGRRKFRK